MSSLVPVRRALVSVSDKSDLVPFVRSLVQHGVSIISTGGTATGLASAGIDVIPIDQVTGVPEMMDGRVKTLHPAIHGGLLALRDRPAHIEALEAHGIGPIDLVCVNLYPFERTILEPEITDAEAIEQIDIGGPAMLRSAAKNHRFVTVVTHPSQYDMLATSMRTNDGATTAALRRDLAGAAFSRTAEYDAAIAAWMATQRDDDFPSTLRLTYTHQQDLRYGENPHQRAALYSNPASGDPSVVRATLRSGKALSYNNILDASAALEVVRDLHAAFEDPSAAVVKHTNPCGAALAGDPPEAIVRALAGDPLAAYGGILAVSRPVDAAEAEAIGEHAGFLEVVLAPSFTDAAVERIAGTWPNCRLLEVGGLRRAGRKIDYRSIPGGMLVQQRDVKLPSTSTWAHAAGPTAEETDWSDAAFATVIVKHVNSNAIVLTADRHLLGVGGGQVDRVTACRLAVAKAGDRLRDHPRPIAASDAFFPFDDGPRLLIDAGVKVLVHPGGSRRDQDTMDLCDEREVVCLVTGTRHFRH